MFHSRNPFQCSHFTNAPEFLHSSALGNHGNRKVAWAWSSKICSCIHATVSSSVPVMASGRRDSSPGRLALAFPSIWKKVRYRWSPHRINSVDLGASTGSLSEALMYPWIVPHPNMPPDGRPRSLSCQLPGPPLRELILKVLPFILFIRNGNMLNIWKYLYPNNW